MADLDVGTLQGTVEIEDRFSSALELFTDKLDTIAEQLEGFEGKVRHAAVEGVAFGTALEHAAEYGLEKFKEGLKEILELGERGSTIIGVRDAFNHLSDSIGQTGEVLLGRLHDGVRGTIGDFELMKSANKALGAGVKLTGDDMEVIGEAARAMGKAMGTDAAGGLNALNSALVRGNTRMLSRVGIVVDVKKAEIDFAKSLGTTADQLNSVGKLEAKRQGILQATRDYVERLGQSELSFKEKLEQGRVAIEEWWDSLAVAVASSPQVNAALDAIGDAFKKAFGDKGKTATDIIMKGVNAVADGIKDLAPVVMTIIQDAKDFWNWLVQLNTEFHISDTVIAIVKTAFHTLKDAIIFVRDAARAAIDTWKEMPEWLQEISKQAVITGAGLYVVGKGMDAAGISISNSIGIFANINTILQTWPLLPGMFKNIAFAVRVLISEWKIFALLVAEFGTLSAIGNMLNGWTVAIFKLTGSLGVLGVVTGTALAAWQLGKANIPIINSFQDAVSKYVLASNDAIPSTLRWLAGIEQLSPEMAQASVEANRLANAVEDLQTHLSKGFHGGSNINLPINGEKLFETALSSSTGLQPMERIQAMEMALTELARAGELNTHRVKEAAEGFKDFVKEGYPIGPMLGEIIRNTDKFSAAQAKINAELEEGKYTVDEFKKKLEDLKKSLSGHDVKLSADAWVAALESMGSASKLTMEQQKQGASAIQAAIVQALAAGIKIPPAYEKWKNALTDVTLAERTLHNELAEKTMMEEGAIFTLVDKLKGADIKKEATKWVAALEEIGDTTKLSMQDQDAAATALNAAIQVYVRAGDEIPAGLTKAIKSVKDFTAAQRAMTNELGEKNLNAAGSIQAIVDQWRGFDIRTKANQLVRAFEEIGDVTLLTAADQQGLNKAVADAIMVYKRLGLAVPSELQTIINATKNWAKVSEHELKEMLKSGLYTFEEIRAKAEAVWNALHPKLIQLHVALGQWATDLRAISDAFGGVDTGLGRLVSGIAEVVSAWDQAAKAADAYGKAKKAQDRTGQALALVQGVTAVTQATKGGGFKGAAGGALAGAELGFEIAGPWGAAIGAGIGLMIGVLRTDHTKADFRRAGKTLGLEFSDGLLDQLAKDKKKFGGEVQAMIVNLDKIISEAGGLSSDNIDMFMGKFRDVFVLIENHQLKIGEGTKILDKNWAEFAEAATAADGRISDSLREIIRLNTAVGTGSKEIAKWLAGQGMTAVTSFNDVIVGMTGGFDKFAKAVTDAQEKVDALAKDGKQGTADYKDAQAELTKALTEQHKAGEQNIGMLKDLGIIAVGTFGAAIASGATWAQALQAAQPGLAALNQAYKDLGLPIDDLATKELLFQSSIMSANPGLIEAIGGLSSSMIALDNMGLLNVQTFEAMERTGKSLFDKLKTAAEKSGASTEEAMRAALAPMQDWLHEAAHQAELLGVPLDDNTQELIDQSIALGIWKDKGKSATDIMIGAMQTLVDTVQDLIDTLNHVPPRVHTTVTTEHEDTWSKQTNPDGGGYDTNGMPEPQPQAAGGDFIVRQPTLFLAGEAGVERATFSGGGSIEGQNGQPSLTIQINASQSIFGSQEVLENTITQGVLTGLERGGFKQFVPLVKRALDQIPEDN